MASLSHSAMISSHRSTDRLDTIRLKYAVKMRFCHHTQHGSNSNHNQKLNHLHPLKTQKNNLKNLNFCQHKEFVHCVPYDP